MRYRKAAFIVVYRKEKGKLEYLVLKRKLHWKGWEFPKGGVDKKKGIISEVKRELKEETGQIPIKISRYKKKGKYNYKKIYADRPGILGQDWKLFACKLKSKKIKLDKLEHSSYKWLKFDRALKLLTWANQKKCLKIVNSYLKHG